MWIEFRLLADLMTPEVERAIADALADNLHVGFSVHDPGDVLVIGHCREVFEVTGARLLALDVRAQRWIPTALAARYIAWLRARR
jgi:hypothetical protein